MKLVTMRVKEGKRALPYNDGKGPKLHEPLEVFEGPEKYLVDFAGHVEQVDAAGNVVNSELDPALAPDIVAARPHERVTMLTDLKKQREDAAKREQAALDAQIKQAQEDAERDANEKRKARGQAVVGETKPVEDRAQPVAAQPESVREAVVDESTSRVNRK